MIFIPLSATETDSLRFPALLIEGTYLVEGIPGFLPNRIPSLFGKYRTGDGGIVEVYGSTEPLFFSADLWSKGRLGSFSIQVGNTLSIGEGENSSVIGIEHRIFMKNALVDRSMWHFFFVFSTLERESFKISFITKFLDRTSFYFSAARRVADLSFPSKL